jgi:NAD-dependent SIR2 family protein deacetylase
MKDYKIKCTNCESKLNEDDLIRGEDDEGSFDGCPTCETDHYLMDL